MAVGSPSRRPRSPSHGTRLAVIAEAAGAALALRLLLQVHADVRQARVYGDCLPVVRFGAATGRLRHPLAHRPLAPALGQIRSAGWSLARHAIPRRHNQAADALATQAALACGPPDRPAAPFPEARFTWVAQPTPTP